MNGLNDTTMVIGVFSEREDAENAIDELHDLDFEAKDISIMTKSPEEAHIIEGNTGSPIAEGTATGAATGGVIGGIAGLLVGLGAIAIPGFGALLIGGPLAGALGLTGAAATTVSGAVTGALAGGLFGALVSLGIPEEDARVYEEHLQQGGILIAVPVSERYMSEVRRILSDHNAQRVRSFHLNAPAYERHHTANLS